MVSIRFISNAGEKLGSHIEHILTWAEEIDIAVAYMKSSGYNFIENLLDGKKIRMLVGFDFWLTDVEPLWNILSKGSHCKIYKTPISNEEKGYHPKIYIAKRKGDVRVVIGSSNLTNGGFYSNVEGNIILSGDKTDAGIREILDFFEEKWNSSLAVDIDGGMISEYADQKREFETHTKQISAKPSFIIKKDKIANKGIALVICMTKNHDRRDIYNRLVGVPIGAKKIAFENIKGGIRLFIYYVGQGISKVVETLDMPYIDYTTIDEWKDGLPETYPVRAKTKLLHSYITSIKLGRLQKLGVCRADTGKILVGYHLQSSLVPITDNDGDMIESELRKADSHESVSNTR